MCVKNERPLKLHETFWFVMLNILVSSYTTYILPLFMLSDFTCKKDHLLACFILFSASIIWGTLKSTWIAIATNLSFMWHKSEWNSLLDKKKKWQDIHPLIGLKKKSMLHIPEWRRTALCCKSYLAIIALSNSLYSCFRGKAIYLHYDERLQR